MANDIKDKLGLKPADMIQLVNEDPRSKTSFFSETALKVQYPMYNLFIEFPTIKNKNYNRVMFPAYISEAITDTFTPTYSDAGSVFGRMDPIPIYSKTTRSIKVAFNIPANSINDAREIRKKLDIMAKNMYPTFEKASGSTSRLIIRKPPLIRIKFGNIICNPLDEYSGLLGILKGGLAINNDLSNGVFTEWPGQEIYAKKYSLSLSMDVLHEFTPGFVLVGKDDPPFQEGNMVHPGTAFNQNVKAGTTAKNQKDRIKEAESKLFGNSNISGGGTITAGDVMQNTGPRGSPIDPLAGAGSQTA